MPPEQLTTDQLSEVLKRFPAQSSKRMFLQRCFLHVSTSTAEEAKRRMRQIAQQDSGNLQSDIVTDAVQQHYIACAIKKIACNFVKQIELITSTTNPVRRLNPINEFHRSFNQRVDELRVNNQGKIKIAAIKIKAFFPAAWIFLKSVILTIIASLCSIIPNIRAWNANRKVFNKLTAKLNDKLSLTDKIRKFFCSFDFSDRKETLSQALVEQYMLNHGEEVWDKLYTAFQAYKKGDKTQLENLARDFTQIIQNIQQEHFLPSSENDKRSDKYKFGVITETVPHISSGSQDENQKIQIEFFPTLLDEEIYSIRAAIMSKRAEYEKAALVFHRAQANKVIAIRTLDDLTDENQKNAILTTAIQEIDPNASPANDYQVLQRKLNSLLNEKRKELDVTTHRLEEEIKKEIEKFIDIREVIVQKTKAHIEQAHQTLLRKIEIDKSFVKANSIGCMKRSTEKRSFADHEDPTVIKETFTDVNTPQQAILNLIYEQFAQLQYRKNDSSVFIYNDSNNKKKYFGEHLKQTLPGNGCKNKIEKIRMQIEIAKNSMVIYEKYLDELRNAINNQESLTAIENLRSQVKKSHKDSMKELYILSKKFQTYLDLIKNGVERDIFGTQQPINPDNPNYRAFLDLFLGNTQKNTKGLQENTVGAIQDMIQKCKEKHANMQQGFQELYDPAAITATIGTEVQLHVAGFNPTKSAEIKNKLIVKTVTEFLHQLNTERVSSAS